MELTSIQNNNFFNYNLQNKGENKIRNNNITAEQKNISVNSMDNIKPQSSVSFSIKDNLNNLASYEQAQKSLSTQTGLINKLSDIISSSSDINTQSSQINTIFEQYNNNVKVIYDNLNELVEDQTSEKSYMYFDGVLGSVPMDIKEINNAIEQQKEVIQEVNSQIDQNKQKEIESTKKIINEQKTSSEYTPKENEFKEVNLKDFSNSLVSAHDPSVQNQSFSITV